MLSAGVDTNMLLLVWLLLCWPRDTCYNTTLIQNLTAIADYYGNVFGMPTSDKSGCFLCSQGFLTLKHYLGNILTAEKKISKQWVSFTNNFSRKRST